MGNRQGGQDSLGYGTGSYQVTPRRRREGATRRNQGTGPPDVGVSPPRFAWSYHRESGCQAGRLTCLKHSAMMRGRHQGREVGAIVYGERRRDMTYVFGVLTMSRRWRTAQ